MSAARRFLGKRPAFLHLRWKVAARRTKRLRTTSWRTSAALISALPVLCCDCERLLFATYDAPLALSVSTTVEMAAKVVRTRPGWIGE